MDNLLWEGINLMVIGMGAVFVFLILLVFATSVMSSLIAKFLPESDQPSLPPSVPVAPSATADAQLVAIITAAIQRHRSRHK